MRIKLGTFSELICESLCIETRNKTQLKTMDVFHVSGAGEMDGVLSSEALARRFPAVSQLVDSHEVHYVQFGYEDENVIIKRESADRFDPSQIIR